MATGSFGAISLFMMLLSGGANDLLDYVSTEQYWAARGVQHVTAQQLLDELKPPAAGPDVAKLVAGLGAGSFEEREQAARQIAKQGPAVIPQLEAAAKSPDLEISSRAKNLIQQLKISSKAASVRRLMAIRTLGEMKKQEAVPALKALLNSKEMFEADYAATAIAMIEGKPLPPRTAPPGAMKTDLTLLPANCGVVGQVSMTAPQGAKRPSIDEALKQLPQMPGEDREQMFKTMQQAVLSAAEQVGNVRVEGLTFGVSDDIGDKQGSVCLIIRGRYDSRAAAVVLRNNLPKPNNAAVEGVEMFSPEDEISFGFPSDERAVFLVGPSRDKLPVKELLTAVRDNKGPLMTNAEMAKLIGAVDPSAAMWAVCKINDNYRQADVIKSFDTINFVAKQDKDAMTFDISGSGTDPAAVQDAVNKVNQGLGDARQHLPQLAQQMPMFKPVVDFVTAAKCEAKGKDASFTSSVPGNGNSLLGFPFFMFGMRAQAIEGRAVPAAPPGQP
jgi:PBS lyase HEAT-like repeat